MLKFTHVDGDESVGLVLYTLSTCGWCKKTKALLHELGAAYDYIDVDQLEDEDVDEAQAEIKKWNPQCSFPTIVVNGRECIVGFREDELRSLLSK